jgi:hypothetical protein
MALGHLLITISGEYPSRMYQEAVRELKRGQPKKRSPKTVKKFSLKE